MAIYLVCYDIVDNRERSRVARLLERHGRRVQDSVFEMHRLDPPRKQRLIAGLRALCDDPTSVRLYRLTLDGLEDSVDLAGNPLATRPAMVIL